MNGVKVLALALFIAIHAPSQDAPSVLGLPPNAFPHPGLRFPYPVPQVSYSVLQNASNPFLTLPQILHTVPLDPSKLFPYAVPPEGTDNPPEQAQCKFSDGKMITVDYSTRHVPAGDFFRSFAPPSWATVFSDIRFFTDGSLTTVEGISVPPGVYEIVSSFHVWPAGRTVMKKDGHELGVRFFFTELASRDEKPALSFEHTGASCIMRVYDKDSNYQASVEFREIVGLPIAR